MTHWQVGAVTPADVTLLRGWQPPGTDEAMPRRPGEAWLLARRASGAAPAASLRVRERIGLTRPRHWFHVGCVVHAAPELSLFNRQTTLLLGSDHTGASELADFVCDLALPAAEQASALRALLHAGWRHMMAHRDAHPGPVIMELPGPRDGQGRSPFWQGLGRHFFDGDLGAVARQQGSEWRSQVAALLPRQPLYTAFLAAPAREAIAQVTPVARSWMDALSHEGFRYSHHISIIDGGPVFESHLDRLSAGG